MENNTSPSKDSPKEIIAGGWPVPPPCWDYARICERADGKVPDPETGYIPPPVGPGDFAVHWTFPGATDRVVLAYEFYSGTEAQLIEEAPGAEIYELRAPKGEVEAPAHAPSTKWILRLPAGTSVYVFPERRRWDVEELKKPSPELSPEMKAAVERYMENYRERRRLEFEQRQKRE